MIESYYIKKINGEEILYLHMNFDMEFAKLNAKKKKKKLNDTISNYIKENNIKFLGTKAAIIVGGVLIGTLLIHNPNQIQENIQIPPTVSILQQKEEIELPKLKENDIVLKEEVKQETVNKKDVSTSNQKETKKEAKAVNKTNQTAKKETTSVSNRKEETPIPKVEEAKTFVTINRKNGTVLNLELEEYVIGVVAAEMPAAFHMEALKAQAIIARTYALKASERGIKLTDTSSTQNYKDNNELKKIWGSSYSTYYNKIKSAVESTKGMYLTYNGKIIDAVYHSTSNGRTEDAKNVWKNAFPYLVSVDSPYDRSNKSYIYETVISYDDLSKKLGVTIDSNSNFNIVSKTEGNRVGLIEIENLTFTGVEFRNKLGLRSADFEIVKCEGGIKVKTTGYGHGVGLSQYGANGMAKNGSSYSSILKHYYKGVTLTKIK